jgi:hypothetical protein
MNIPHSAFPMKAVHNAARSMTKGKHKPFERRGRGISNQKRGEAAREIVSLINQSIDCAVLAAAERYVEWIDKDPLFREFLLKENPRLLPILDSLERVGRKNRVVRQIKQLGDLTNRFLK